jgi:hypothetical protein
MQARAVTVMAGMAMPLLLVACATTPAPPRAGVAAAPIRTVLPTIDFFGQDSLSGANEPGV